MVKKRVHITPILQTLLVNQMAKVLECLNAGDYWGAWLSTRNLILASPPGVQNHKDGENDETLLEKVEAIKIEMNKIISRSEINVVLGQENKRAQIMRLLPNRVIPLFHATMLELYEGGYMEAVKDIREGTFGEKDYGVKR